MEKNCGDSMVEGNGVTEKGEITKVGRNRTCTESALSTDVESILVRTCIII